MKLVDFIRSMDELYPCTLSCDWDTDGLQLLVDPDRELKRVLVTLDAGYPEACAAADGGYDLLLTHHPLIFGGTREITPTSVPGNRILKLIGAGVSAASYHTRLDAGSGGVNDCLAKALDIENAEPFGDSEMPNGGRIADISETTAGSLAELAKMRLNSPLVKLSGDPKKPVRRVALIGGAGKDFIIPALRAGADAIITGEASYSSAHDLSEYGIAIIEAGHFHTEFPVTERLAALVREIAGACADVRRFDKQTVI